MIFARLAKVSFLSAVVVSAVACSSSSSSTPNDAGSGGSTGSGGSAPGTGGASATGGSGGGAVDVPADTSSTDMAGDGGTLTAEQMRGQYLTGLLGCVNCHTPKLTGGALDTANLFAGVDCTANASGDCLSTPNLTPDMTGIKAWTDQQVIDAFRMGKDPEMPADGGVAGYLFSNMPYYQYANLTDDDAKAIVAYLRQLPPIVHQEKANAGMFATPPATPQWTPADPTKLPAPGVGAPADAANGKYLATLMCATCHTANTGTASPLHIDETKAFQGGKTSSITGDGGTMMFQSSNLTPDMMGIKDWTAMDLVTAIRMAKDKMGKTLCAPMRANANITPADATAIADYLLSLPPVANPAVTACMARM